LIARKPRKNCRFRAVFHPVAPRLGLENRLRRRRRFQLLSAVRCFSNLARSRVAHG
jgi:hypothetical protein